MWAYVICGVFAMSFPVLFIFSDKAIMFHVLHHFIMFPKQWGKMAAPVWTKHATFFQFCAKICDFFAMAKRGLWNYASPTYFLHFAQKLVIYVSEVWCPWKYAFMHWITWLYHHVFLLISAVPWAGDHDSVCPLLLALRMVDTLSPADALKENHYLQDDIILL